MPSNMEGSSVAERYMRYVGAWRLAEVDREIGDADENVRNVDVTMLQMLNTQERSESQWREVVNAADLGLELTRIKPKGSWDSIIEISLVLI